MPYSKRIGTCSQGTNKIHLLNLHLRSPHSSMHWLWCVCHEWIQLKKMAQREHVNSLQKSTNRRHTWIAKIRPNSFLWHWKQTVKFGYFLLAVLANDVLFLLIKKKKNKIFSTIMIGLEKMASLNGMECTWSVWQTSKIRSRTLFVRKALCRHSVLKMAFWQNQNDIETKSIGTVSKLGIKENAMK